MTNMNLKKGFVIIFFCVIFLPLTLTIFGDWEQKNYDVALKDNSGITYTYPRFNFENYADRSFQSEFENAWNSDFALHGVLTRTYNQIRFSMFKMNRTAANREYIGTDLVVGKNKNIFEYQYIAEYFLLDQFIGFDTEESREQMECYADLLEEISDKLDQVDKKVIFLTTPNKCDYMSEDIPANFQYAKDGIRAIDVFEEIVEGSSINYVSGRRISDKNKEKFPIFYCSGIHWSRPIEQIVCGEVIRQFGENCKYVELGDLHASDVPYWRDADVWKLLNIWENSDEIYYQYDESMMLPAQYENCRVLIQGGSFAEGLRKMLIDNNISPLVQYINYDNALIDADGNVETYINQDWNNLDLQKALDNADVIVIEVNENRVGAYAYNNGFAGYLNVFLDSYVPNEEEGPANLDFKGNYLDEKYKLNGIYPYENGEYAWSGKYTYIQLDNANIAQKGLEIDCDIPEQICADGKLVSVLLCINGCKVQEVSYDPGKHVIIIDKEKLSEVTDEECRWEIEIYVPSSFRPIDYGINDDTRNLSIKINYVGEVR